MTEVSPQRPSPTSAGRRIPLSDVGRVSTGPDDVSDDQASGRDTFHFEYPNWQQHLLDHRPHFAKVLVRYNPDGDIGANLLQRDRLLSLSDFLQTTDIRLLLELVVPPTAAQLAKVGGDEERFSRSFRAELAVKSMAEMQASGIEADLWKLEGAFQPDHYRELAAQARTGGRHRVACLVLGAGAPLPQVHDWLVSASKVEGFAGFAVGRSIWWDAIGDWFENRITTDHAVRQIAASYTSLIRVFDAADSER